MKEVSEQAKKVASQEYITLFNYIINVPNGTLVEYSAVEKDTGIKMDTKNKPRLHKACVASGREYQLVKGIGYQLADGKNALTIVNSGIHKVGNSVLRLKRTHINIKIDIYQEMNAEDKKRFLFTESVTNAITQSIDQSIKLQSHEIHKLSEGKPIIPE